MMSISYEVEDLEIGMINKMTVGSVMMPRAIFMEIFDDAVKKCTEREDANPGQGVINEIRGVAMTMPRFPLDTWINVERGCGCVVGEYLVARAEVDRVALMQQIVMMQPRRCVGATRASTTTVETLLCDNPDRDFLISFGAAVDRLIKRHLLESMGEDALCEVANVEITDDNKETAS